ncbi:MAG: peptidylprolyl isomerase [Planctomycetaceae bacterium]|jgi:cyclophilin family peptidyl-prolyl cis-trans isomerase|nr:peptidylprolyl isomerase [Planctomycetaceae bacterium]
MKKLGFAGTALFLTLIFTASHTPTFAQNTQTQPETTPNAASPDPTPSKVFQDYDELVAELSKLGEKNKAFFDSFTPYREVLGKLQSFVTEYQTAKPERKDQIQAEYDKLVAQAEPRRKELVKSAVEAFTEKPFENPIVLEFLFQILNYESARDNYEVSYTIAAAILQHEKELSDQVGGLYLEAAKAAYGAMEFDKAEAWYKKAMELKVQPPQSELERHPLFAVMSNPSELSVLKKLWAEELAVREKETAADNLPRVLIKTNKGNITLELFENEAPNTVANFIYLVKRGFYKNVPFHRVLPHFMAQGGDPTGTGTSGPGYNIDDECRPQAGKPAPRKHFRGSISMANAGPNTNGSQFFLMFLPVTHLNGKHTVFGRVVEGIELLADIQRIDPQDEVIAVAPDRIIEATVLRDRGHAYEPVKNDIRR